MTHIATTSIHGRPWKVSFMPASQWYPEVFPDRFVIEENLGHATGKVLGKNGTWGITANWFWTPEEAKAWAEEMIDR